ncbi:MAG: MotA/TolQ/ExbB proton channel family protein [Verrucomicrobia bacterium]|nr:MotA/TolQ/ExbB proton channel family protein [Verrucomicrobiota bacterium]
MRYLYLALFLAVGTVQGFASDDSFSQMYAEEDELLALDREIEALLEDDVLGDEDHVDELDEIALKTTPCDPLKESAVLPVQNRPVAVPVKEAQKESIAVLVDRAIAENEKMVVSVSNPLEVAKEETTKSIQTIEINLKEVFSGAPVIYLILFVLSSASLCIWLYSMLTIRPVEFLPPKLVKEIRTKLISNQFDEALDLCVKEKHFFCKMLASGILARKHGLNVMLETMKAEGKRCTVTFWQRIGLLNEIAIIAPMLGLLGTVLGMFYAFYDLNRSMESVSLLFDGLGVSVGTTVAGLIVAILAMVLYAIAKYRLVRILASVETEAQTFASLIDTCSPNYAEK